MRFSEHYLSKTLVGWSCLPLFFRDYLVWTFFFIRVVLLFWPQTTFNAILFLKSLKVCAIVCVSSLSFPVSPQILFASSIIIVVSLECIYTSCLWSVWRILQLPFSDFNRSPSIICVFIRSYGLHVSGFSSSSNTTPLVCCVAWALPLSFFCSVQKWWPSSFYVLLFLSASPAEIGVLPSWIWVLL